MRSPQKRTRRHRHRRNRTPKDYIPLDIVDVIFTFLPIQLACQYGSVAKRFKDVWKYSRKLEFDREFARNFHIHTYYQIVDNALAIHSGPKIQTFSIYFDPTGTEDQVKSWIDIVISKGVEELDLQFFGLYTHRKFALGDLGLPMVRVLRLSFCNFAFSWTTNQLPLLSTLVLKHVNIGAKMINKVIENCMLLKTIDIVYCKTNGRVSIPAHHLTRFTTLKIGDCPDICHIDIDAPSLRTFHYTGKFVHLWIRNVFNLSDVFLNFKYPTSGFVPGHEIRSTMWELYHTSVLTISSVFLEGLASAYRQGLRGVEEMPYTFWNLEELQLYVEGSLICNAYDIASFLVRCPHLERLFIDVRESSMETSVLFEEEQNQALEKISDMLRKLRLIRLYNFQFQKNEVKLVKFLLQKADNLELLYITTPKFSPTEVRALRQKARGTMDCSNWKTSRDAKIVVNSFYHDNCDFHPVHHPKWY